MKLPKLEVDQVLECIFEKVSLIANAAKNRASFVRKMLNGIWRESVFNKMSFLTFLGGFYTERVAFLVFFFLQLKGFLPLQWFPEHSKCLLSIDRVSMSFIQRFSAWISEIGSHRIQRAVQACNQGFFSRIKSFFGAFVIYKTGSFTAMRYISNVFKQLFVLVQ